jgi:hypothetical protein
MEEAGRATGACAPHGSFVDGRGEVRSSDGSQRDWLVLPRAGFPRLRRCGIPARGRERSARLPRFPRAKLIPREDKTGNPVLTGSHSRGSSRPPAPDLGRFSRPRFVGPVPML